MARIVRSPRIGSASARARLSQRAEPYWQPISRGCALGYRKGANGGSWIARWRNGDGKKTYHAIGPADDGNDNLGLDYEAALRKARVWFEQQDEVRGRRSDLTVDEAIDDYLKFLKRARSGSTAYDAERRAAKYIKTPVDDEAKEAGRGSTLGKRQVRLLTREEVCTWRDGLLDQLAKDSDPELQRKAKDTANRILTILKAALNRAYEQRDDIPSDRAWRPVKPFRDVGRPRTVFLTSGQLQRLVNGTNGGFRDLVIAAMATGARYGEIAGAKVRDFDEKAGTLHVDGKTGPREVFLDDAGIEFFTELAAGRPPDDPLITKDDGTTWGKSHQARPWAEASARAKLPAGATFYCLRHSYASQKLLAGMNHQVLSENLGTSVRMLEVHYGKFMRSDRRRLMNDTAIGLDLPLSTVVALKPPKRRVATGAKK